MFSNRLPRGSNCYICHVQEIEGLTNIPKAGHLVAGIVQIVLNSSGLVGRIGGQQHAAEPHQQRDSAVAGAQLQRRPGLQKIAGPSGSGKSSLLRILAGIDIPAGGIVFVTTFAFDNRGGWLLAGIQQMQQAAIRHADRESTGRPTAKAAHRPLLKIKLGGDGDGLLSAVRDDDVIGRRLDAGAELVVRRVPRLQHIDRSRGDAAEHDGRDHQGRIRCQGQRGLCQRRKGAGS